METIQEWQNMALSAFTRTGEQLSSGIMNLIGALLVLFIGWVLTKFIVFLVKKILNAARVNKLTEKISNLEWFKNSVKIDIVQITTFFVKWILYLVIIVIAAEIMQWSVVSNEISNLFNYLPNLFIAITLFLVGVYIADFVKKALGGVIGSLNLVGAKTISSIAFYIIVIIFTVTALNQAKVDTTLITSNIVIIISGAVLMVSIAVGIGSIDTVQKMLLTHYSRKNFSAGDSVKVGDLKGSIKSIDSTTVVIETVENKVVFVPIKEFTSSNIEVI